MTGRQLFDGIEYNREQYTDWRQVVDHAAEFFISHRFAEKAYFEYVKKDLEDNEAYMVIVPHIVLLHSAPEHGALRNAFHFMKLEHPVNFCHECNDPVRIVISFACTSSQEHLESIERLAAMLMDENFVSRIFEISSEPELKEYLQEISVSL